MASFLKQSFSKNHSKTIIQYEEVNEEVTAAEVDGDCNDEEQKSRIGHTFNSMDNDYSNNYGYKS